MPVKKSSKRKHISWHLFLHAIYSLFAKSLFCRMSQIIFTELSQRSSLGGDTASTLNEHIEISRVIAAFVSSPIFFALSQRQLEGDSPVNSSGREATRESAIGPREARGSAAQARSQSSWLPVGRTHALRP